MCIVKLVNFEVVDFMICFVKFVGFVGFYVEVNVVIKVLECVIWEDFKIRDGEVKFWVMYFFVWIYNYFSISFFLNLFFM